MTMASSLSSTIKASALQKHLQSNPNLLSTLRTSSCLLITSAPPQDDHSKIVDGISNHIQSTTSFLAGRYNLRTSTPLTISSAYPTTPLDINKANKMMNRVGSDVVIGIGSGSAIDLAKSLSFVQQSDDLKEMILIPSTCGAAMAAGSTLPLFLDEKEEMLLPPASAPDKNSDIQKTVIIDTKAAIVPIQTKENPKMKKYGELARAQDVAYASLALCLDVAQSIDENPSHANSKEKTAVLNAAVQKSLLILQQLREQHKLQQDEKPSLSSIQQNALEASFLSGQLVSFGNATTNSGRRTIPLALASALLPHYFPRGNLLSFYASLLPGLCATYDNIMSSSSSFKTLTQVSKLILSIEEEDEEYSTLLEWSNDTTRDDSPFGKCTTLSSLAMDTPTVQDMMKKMSANNTLLFDVMDADDDILECVLHYSLNR